MTSPVRTLIDSELRRLTARRGMIQLQAGLVFVLLLMTTMVAITGSYGVAITFPPVAAGQSYAGEVLMVQAAFLLWGMSLLVFEEAGTVQQEILQLLRLSGLSAWQWLVARLGAIVPLLLSIALLPLPFLALAPSLGGVSWTGIAAAEAVIASHLAMLLAFALFQSTRLDTKGGIGNLLSIEVLVEVVIPFIVSLVLQILEQGFLRDELEAAALVLSCSTATRAIQDSIRGTLAPSQFALACAVPLGLASLLGRIVVNRLYAPSDEQSLPDPAALAEIPETPIPEPVARPAPVEPVSGPISRPSERCWDDALAWHAVFFQTGPAGTRSARKLLFGKSALYGVVILGVILFEMSGPSPWEGIVLNIAAVLIAIVVLAGVGYPAKAFGRELDDRMMEMLLLTPHDGADFYDGWSRGARRLQFPEYAIASVLIGVLLATRTPVWGAVASAVLAGLLALGPVVAFGSLLPSGFRGSLAAVWLLVVIGLTVFCAGVVGVWLNPWAAVPVVWICIWGIGRLCRQGIDSRLRSEYEERDRREP